MLFTEGFSFLHGTEECSMLQRTDRHMPCYFKVVHSVHFYISLRRLLHQLNAHS